MTNRKLPLTPDAFMQIAEQALTGFMIFSIRSRTCEYANQIARETLAIHEGIESLTLDQMFPEPGDSSNRRFKPFNDDLLNFEGLFQEIIIRKISGQNFVASLGVRKMNLAGDGGETEAYLLLMLQDMSVQVKLQREVEAKQTQINAAYQELILQNSQLKELDLAKNRFIALITHELRTPISGIVASSEILKMKLYDNEKQRDEFVEMIHSESHHLLELVNDVLDFAKIQAGKMDFFIEQKDILPVLQQELELLQNMASQESITIQCVLPPQPVFCYFDELRLKQVIANVVNNAIKYNKPGGTVTVWIKADENQVTLYVKDTGKGIKPEDQPKIFNEFETLGKISLHNKGTGLGLPITKRLLTYMGGTIQLTSEANAGTTFWISLPTKKILNEGLYRSRPGSDDTGDLAA